MAQLHLIRFALTENSDKILILLIEVLMHILLLEQTIEQFIEIETGKQTDPLQLNRRLDGIGLGQGF